MTCECSMRIKLVGDGCSECNPELHLELVTERMEEAEAKLDDIGMRCDAYLVHSVAPSNSLAVLKRIKSIIDD